MTQLTLELDDQPSPSPKERVQKQCTNCGAFVLKFPDALVCPICKSNGYGTLVMCGDTRFIPVYMQEQHRVYGAERTQEELFPLAADFGTRPKTAIERTVHEGNGKWGGRFDI